MKALWRWPLGVIAGALVHAIGFWGGVAIWEHFESETAKWATVLGWVVFYTGAVAGATIVASVVPRRRWSLVFAAVMLCLILGILPGSIAFRLDHDLDPGAFVPPWFGLILGGALFVYTSPAWSLATWITLRVRTGHWTSASAAP
jgi:hypothetical protein